MNLPVLASRALVSGTLAAAAVSLVASLATRRLARSAPAALNATSHFAWGERAARQDDYSLKYTGTGAATNYGASILWALFYEGLALQSPRTPGRALRNGALVSALAYVVDYHVVPKRLTPGFELRLGAPALACIYGALALGLAARDVFVGGRATRGSAGPRLHRSLARGDTGIASPLSALPERQNGQQVAKAIGPKAETPREIGT